MTYKKEIKINLGNYNMGLISIEDTDKDGVKEQLKKEIENLIKKDIPIDDNVKKFVGLL